MSVMPPDVREDEDTFILENLDFDLTCGWKSGTSECDKRAKWLCTHLCCAYEVQLCDEHRGSKLKFLRDHPRVFCKVCSFRWYPKDTVNFTWGKL